jgi:predicted NUDIX family phosphoesterase
LRSNLNVWKEDKFAALQAVGIKELRRRVAALIAKELPKAKPGAWRWVQAHELQSIEGAHETWTSVAQGILSTLIR